MAEDLTVALRAPQDLQVRATRGWQISAAERAQQRDVLMQRRRDDRVTHQHRQIWTKDPHGGPYRKAGGSSSGYDALLQLPSGQARRVEPGYERPQTGPTTNFVGNHMTQGAIDLVQMRQQGVEAELVRRELQRYRRLYHPPKLIQSSPSSGCALRLAAPCAVYQWVDCGATVRITVPLPDDIPVAIARDAVDCQIARATVRVTMTGGGGLQRVLRLEPLWAPVLPQRSSWRPHNGVKFPHTSEVEDAAGAVVVAGIRPWAVRITLCKEDTAIAWNGLVRDEAPLQPWTSLNACFSRESGISAPRMSLQAMRTAIRRQRTAKQPGDGLLFALQRPNGGSDPGRNDGVCKGSTATTHRPEESMAEATSCTACGDYGGALSHLDAAIQSICGAEAGISTTDTAAHGPLAGCYSQRAACHREMGNVQAAISDTSRAIAVLQTMDGAAAFVPGPDQAAKAHATVASATVILLTARGALLEQAEQHTASLADFEAALKLDAANAAAMLAAARLREIMKGKPDDSITGSQMHVAWRSVPRPGMRVFENRGKAGAAF